MRKMISKNSYYLYWINRRVEQADSMLRLLSGQLQQLPKDSSQTLALGWEWIFKSLNVQVPSGFLLEENKKESSDFCQADAYTLVDYFTFETGHEHSILSCLQSAQKQFQKYINSPAKEILNHTYLLLTNTSMKEIWPQTKTLDFYKKIQTSLCLFYHSLDNNFYRGEDFYFIQLGRSIERFNLIISILNIHAQHIIGWKDTKKELESLLFYCGAFDLYHQAYGLEKNIQKVFDFIVSNPESPRSLLFSLNKIDLSIQNINLKTTTPQILNESIQSLKEKITSSHQSALIPFLEAVQTQFQTLCEKLTSIYFQDLDFNEEELKKHG